MTSGAPASARARLLRLAQAWRPPRHSGSRLVLAVAIEGDRLDAAVLAMRQGQASLRAAPVEARVPALGAPGGHERHGWEAAVAAIAWAALHRSGTDRAELDSVIVGADAAPGNAAVQVLGLLFGRPALPIELPLTLRSTMATEGAGAGHDEDPLLGDPPVPASRRRPRPRATTLVAAALALALIVTGLISFGRAPRAEAPTPGSGDVSTGSVPPAVTDPTDVDVTSDPASTSGGASASSAPPALPAPVPAPR